MVGKRVLIIVKSTILPGTYMEQSFKVQSVHQYLTADRKAGRRNALVQFYTIDGGMRTVRAADTIKIQ